MEYCEEFEKIIYEPDHLQQVLGEIKNTFPSYFQRFLKRSLQDIFSRAITQHEKAYPLYERFLDLEKLKDFKGDPHSFKKFTKDNCPIIWGCLQSPANVMNKYKASFYGLRDDRFLNAVMNIAQFGENYYWAFDGKNHEAIRSYQDLALQDLNSGKYGCSGVIGYGVQSAFLFGRYPDAFAHRSQNAIWSLYFLTKGRKFGLYDCSEFMRVQPDHSTCEQNYFYPADLFGFHALQLYLILNKACKDSGISLDPLNRYIYLHAFTDFIANVHIEDIKIFENNSDDREFDWH
jgi:hypothetical protein